MAETGHIKELIAKLYNFRTRAEARRKLGELGSDAASVLLPLLTAAEVPENVRWSAITLLGECKCEDSVPALLDIAQNDLRLRGEAVRALQIITGNDIGEDPEAWAEALGEKGSQNPKTTDGTVPSPTHEEAKPEEAGRSTAESVEQPAEDTGSAKEPVEAAVFRQALQELATNITWEDAGYLYMRLSLHEGRKQQMIVQFGEGERAKERTVTIYTECGPAIPAARNVLPQRNSTLRYGAFVVEEAADSTAEGKVVMRHSMPVSKLTPEQAREIVLYMASEADALEYAITGSDQI